MLTPVYIPHAATGTPDIFRAVQDFIMAYGLSGEGSLEEADIFDGWPCLHAGPPASSEYAVVSILATSRRGTNIEWMPGTSVQDHEPEIYKLRAYHEVLVQVDLCSGSDQARQKASSLESVFRSPVGVAFFKPHGLTAQYAEGVEETSQEEDADPPVRRYGILLHLAYWAGVDVGSAWFTNVNLDKVEDADRYRGR